MNFKQGTLYTRIGSYNSHSVTWFDTSLNKCIRQVLNALSPRYDKLSIQFICGTDMRSLLTRSRMSRIPGVRHLGEREPVYLGRSRQHEGETRGDSNPIFNNASGANVNIEGLPGCVCLPGDLL